MSNSNHCTDGDRENSIVQNVNHYADNNTTKSNNTYQVPDQVKEVIIGRSKKSRFNDLDQAENSPLSMSSLSRATSGRKKVLILSTA